MSISWRRDVLAAIALVASGCLHATRLDSDGDGIDDELDNCPSAYNPDQSPDACDCPSDRFTHRDLDNDGIDDGCDQCIGPGPTGVDSDGDGIDDGCDPCVNGVSTFDVDDDHDGVPDGCDTCVGFTGVDIDRDGIDDSCDACLAGPPDDQDGDGIEDGCDLCPVIPSPGNAAMLDGDQIGDACDPWLTDDDRLTFDGFRVPDKFTWKLVGSTDAIAIEGDHLTLGAPDSAPDPVFYGTAVTAVFGQFQAMTRVLLAGTTGVKAGIGLYQLSQDDTTIERYVTCTIQSDGTAFVDQLEAGARTQTQFTTPAGPGGDGSFTLAIVDSEVGPSSTVTCQVRMAADPTMTAFSHPITLLGSGWHYGPAAFQAGAVFDWFEMLEQALGATPL